MKNHTFVALTILKTLVILSFAFYHTIAGFITLTRFIYRFIRSQQDSYTVIAEVVHQVETLTETVDDLKDEFTGYAVKLANFNLQATVTINHLCIAVKKSYADIKEVVTDIYYYAKGYYDTVAKGYFTIDS